MVTRDGVTEPTTEIDPARAIAGARDATPLFSGSAERRATFRPSLRVDGAVCATGRACLAGAARIGLTFMNFLEVSGGVRWERDTRAPLWATFGLGLHGQFPAIPRLAIFLGSQLAVADEGVRVSPTLGARVRPVADFWVGVNPAAVTYFSPEKRFAYTPSLEMAYEF
ncbi:hypothetical protein [Pendulispora albinea]|uniref:Uncharacterized protein n=1 Tax=Pendulispora albinea TaxID=2741071 RepID=A0ABZ2M4A6_9BACT